MDVAILRALDAARFRIRRWRWWRRETLAERLRWYTLP